MKNIASNILLIAGSFLMITCKDEVPLNKEMIDLLSSLEKNSYSPKNNFCPEAKLEFFNSMKSSALKKGNGPKLAYYITSTLLEVGNEQEVVATGYEVMQTIPPGDTEHRMKIMKNIALAHLRMGERRNCVINHSGESCIFPIVGKGVHADKAASQQAIEI